MRLSLSAITLCILIAMSVGGCGLFFPEPDPIWHYVQGRILSDCGEYNAALEELAQSIRDDPELSVAHIATGDIHYHREHYEKARSSYETACSTNPYSSSAHYKLAGAYEKLAKIAENAGKEFKKFIRKAVGAYLTSVKLDPDNFDANKNLSTCYIRLGKYDLAEKYCKEAIRLDPNNHQARELLGTIYSSQNRLHMAINAYKDSLELNANQPILLLNLGTTYMRQERYKTALKIFKKAAALIPENADPWIQIGVCHHRINQYDEALNAYRKAIGIKSDNYTAYRKIGDVYKTRYELDQNEKVFRDKAIVAWGQSLKINPNQNDLKKQLQVYLDAKKKSEDAAQQRLVERGLQYLKDKQYDQAARVFGTATKYDPSNPGLWRKLGLCHFRLKNYDQALQAYRQTAKLKSDDPIPYKNMGSVYMTQYYRGGKKSQELYNKALQAWRKSLKINPNQPKLQKLLKKYELRQ